MAKRKDQITVVDIQREVGHLSHNPTRIKVRDGLMGVNVLLGIVTMLAISRHEPLAVIAVGAYLSTLIGVIGLELYPVAIGVANALRGRQGVRPE